MSPQELKEYKEVVFPPEKHPPQVNPRHEEIAMWACYVLLFLGANFYAAKVWIDGKRKHEKEMEILRRTEK